MSETNTTSTQLAKLLSTKICHDLAGPLGGMSNGVEFLSETIGDNDSIKQPLSLLALSSEEGAAKLQMFRQAYGIINQVGEKTEISFLKELFKNYFKHSRIEILWDENNLKAIDHRSRQALVNLALIANTFLIMGGKIKISLTYSDSLTIKIDAEGKQIKKDPDLIAILENKASLDKITPNNSQAFFTIQLISELGCTLKCDINDSVFSIIIYKLP